MYSSLTVYELWQKYPCMSCCYGLSIHLKQSRRASINYVGAMRKQCAPNGAHVETTTQCIQMRGRCVSNTARNQRRLDVYEFRVAWWKCSFCNIATRPNLFSRKHFFLFLSLFWHFVVCAESNKNILLAGSLLSPDINHRHGNETKKEMDRWI